MSAQKTYHTAEDLRDLEQKVARRIDLRTSWIGLVASLLLFLISVALPFTGKATGIDVALFNQKAHEFGATPIEAIYVYVAMVTIVVLNLVMLATRNLWATYVAWVMGGVTITLALFTIWLGQTRQGAHGSSGTEFGAVINAVSSLLFMCVVTSIIFRRSDDQIDLEEARRDAQVSDPVADAQLEASVGRRYSRYEDNPLFVDDRRSRVAERHKSLGLSTEDEGDDIA